MATVTLYKPTGTEEIRPLLCRLTITAQRKIERIHKKFSQYFFNEFTDDSKRVYNSLNPNERMVLYISMLLHELHLEGRLKWNELTISRNTPAESIFHVEFPLHQDDEKFRSEQYQIIKLFTPPFINLERIKIEKGTDLRKKICHMLAVDPGVSIPYILLNGHGCEEGICVQSPGELEMNDILRHVVPAYKPQSIDYHFFDENKWRQRTQKKVSIEDFSTAGITLIEGPCNTGIRLHQIINIQFVKTDNNNEGESPLYNSEIESLILQNCNISNHNYTNHVINHDSLTHCIDMHTQPLPTKPVLVYGYCYGHLTTYRASHVEQEILTTLNQQETANFYSSYGGFNVAIHIPLTAKILNVYEEMVLEVIRLSLPDEPQMPVTENSNTREAANNQQIHPGLIAYATSVSSSACHDEVMEWEESSDVASQIRHPVTDYDATSMFCIPLHNQH